MGRGGRSGYQGVDRGLRALSRSGMSIDQAIAAVPGIPRGPEGPVFREPWEAEAFAMAVALHERGLFAWSEWTAVLAEEIRRAQANGVPDAAALARYRDAWDRAADRTPHGAAIVLQPEDFVLAKE